MKIKWNWGWGIFLSIVLFMATIIIIVATMMNREVDLVTDKYYGKFLSLTFPKDVKASGGLYFYRPANLHKDFLVPINLDNNFSQLLDVSKLDKGLWKLQINWSINNKDYYTEKTLMLN